MNDFKVLLQAQISADSKQEIDKQIKKISDGLNGVEIKISQQSIKDMGFALEQFKKMQSSRLDLIDAKDVNRVKELQARINSLTSDMPDLKNQFVDIRNEITLLGRESKSSISTLDQFVMKFIGINEILQTSKQVAREMISEVYAIDESLVELSKTTNLSSTELNAFANESFDIGKKLSATMTDVIDATASFSRAGFNIGDSKTLAEQAIIMKNISENMKDTGDNATALTNILKGYNLEVSEAARVNDIFNNISNNQNITFDQLISGTREISGVMELYGNSIEETAAMLTGIISVTGVSGEEASKAIRTITMRLSGLTDEGDKDVEMMAKLNDEFNKIAKMDLMTPSGEMRDMFDIVDEYVDKIKELNISQEEQYYLAEKVAGKQRASSFTAMVQNWSTVRESIELANNALGSAADEQLKYEQSLRGVTDSLTASFQKLAMNSINSDMVKSVLKLTDGFVQLIDKVGLLNTVLLSTATYLSFTKNAGVVGGINAMSSAFTSLATSIGLTNTALLGVTGLIGAGIFAGVKIFDAVTESVQELEQKSSDAKTRIEQINAQLESLRSMPQSDEQQNVISGLEKELQLRQDIANTADRKIAEKQVFGDNATQVLTIGIKGKGDLQESKALNTELMNQTVALISLKQKIDDVNTSDEERISLIDKKLKLEDNLKLTIGDALTYNDNLSSNIDKLNDSQKKQVLSQQETSSGLIDAANNALGLKDSIESVSQSTDNLAESQDNLNDSVVDDSSADSLSRLSSEFQAVTDSSNILKTAIGETNAFMEANKGSNVEMADSLIFTEDTLKSLAKEYPSLLSCMENEQQLISELNRLYMEDARAETLKGLQNSYKDATSSLSTLNGILEEYNKHGKISQASMNSIISTYPEMLSAMGDEETFRNALIQKIGEQESAQAQALGQMIVNQNEYAEVIKQIDNQLYQELLMYYQTYSENYAAAMSGSVEAWGNMEQAKLTTTASLIEKLGTLWKSYFSAISQGFAALGSSIPTIANSKITHKSDFTPDEWNSLSGVEKQAISNMENQVRNTTEAGKAFSAVGEALNGVLTNFDIGGAGEIKIPVSTDLGGSKSGGSSKKDNADKQRSEAFKKELEKIQSARDKLDNDIDATKSKIQLAETKNDQAEVERLTQSLEGLLTQRRKLTEEENVKYRALAKTYTKEEEISELEKLMTDNSISWWDETNDILQLQLDLLEKRVEILSEPLDDMDLTLSSFDSQLKVLEVTNATLEEKVRLNEKISNQAQIQAEYLKITIDDLYKQRDLMKEGSAQYQYMTETIIDFESKYASALEKTANAKKYITELFKTEIDNAISQIDKLESVAVSELESVYKNTLDKLEKEREAALSALDNKYYDGDKDKWEEAIDSEIDALNKQLDTMKEVNEEEEYRKKLKEEQIKLTEAQERLDNLKKQRTTQILKQQSDGSWQWDYTYDIDAVENAEKEVADIKQNIADMEADYEKKKQEESIRNQITHLQEKKDNQQKAYEEEKKALTEHFDKQKEMYDEDYQRQKEDLEVYFQTQRDMYLAHGEETNEIVSDNLDVIGTTFDEKMNSITEQVESYLSQIKDAFDSATSMSNKMSSMGSSSGGGSGSSNSVTGATGKEYTYNTDGSITVDRIDGSSSTVKPGDSNYNATVDAIEKDLNAKGKKYANGGLVSHTGLAWVDGSPSKPEYVLNSEQTQAFMQLSTILGNTRIDTQTARLSGTNSINAGTINSIGGFSKAENNTSKSISIQKVELPGVQNAGQFVEELDRIFDKAEQQSKLRPTGGWA